MRLALTKRSGDAIRVLLHLAARPEGTRLPASVIAEESGVTQGNIATLTAALSRADILDCARGPGGGCALARSPDAITIGEAVRAIEGSLEPDHCAIDDRSCTEREFNCGIHQTWRGVIREMVERLDGLTVAQALADHHANGEAAAGGGRSDATIQDG